MKKYFVALDLLIELEDGLTSHEAHEKAYAKAKEIGDKLLKEGLIVEATPTGDVEPSIR